MRKPYVRKPPGYTSARMKAMWADPEMRARMSQRPSFEERDQAIEAAGEATCAKCTRMVPLADFPVARKKRNGQPRYAYCKTCHGAYQRERRLQTFYKITPEEYERMLVHQNGGCALCHRPPARVRLAVDHDHRTGLIRGLLCNWCNRAIGQFRDDVDKVRQVVTYFTDPPSITPLGGRRIGTPGRVTNKVATQRRLIAKREKKEPA